MVSLDWSQCPAVESVPERSHGAWVFRGTRMPVATIFENLEVGAGIEEIIEQYDVRREQIQAVLEFAARSLDAPAVRVKLGVCWMRILFDQGVPRGLAASLSDGHDIVEARKLGWEEVANGELLRLAEAEGFDLLITTDKNVRYQHKMGADARFLLLFLGNRLGGLYGGVLTL